MNRSPIVSFVVLMLTITTSSAFAQEETAPKPDTTYTLRIEVDASAPVWPSFLGEEFRLAGILTEVDVLGAPKLRNLAVGLRYKGEGWDATFLGGTSINADNDDNAVAVPMVGMRASVGPDALGIPLWAFGIVNWVMGDGHNGGPNEILYTYLEAHFTGLGPIQVGVVTENIFRSGDDQLAAGPQVALVFSTHWIMTAAYLFGDDQVLLKSIFLF